MNSSHASRRHPWRCPQKITVENHSYVCQTYNLARYEFCASCGAPYAQEELSEPSHGTSIAERVSIAAAVEEWEQMAREVRRLFAQLSAIEERAGLLFLDQRFESSISRVGLSGEPRSPASFSDPDAQISRAEREIWSAIVGRSGIRRVMSATRSDEVDKQLRDGDLPPLTVENMRSWMADAQGSAEQLLREKIEEVFNFLHPRGSYKTNKPFEIGKKVVLTGIVEPSDPRWSWSIQINHWRDPMLTSMETLFKTLDGKGGSTSGWKSDLHVAIEAANPEDGRFETEYFSGRVFRNGNAHIEFQRMDLVAKLNAAAGGKKLKSSRKAA